MPGFRDRLRLGSKGGTEVIQGMTRDEVRRLFEQFRGEMMQEIKRTLMETVGEEGAVQIKGDRGYSPAKGVDYNDGAPGRDGQNGRNGRDGKDADPEEVAKIVLTRLPKPVKAASKEKKLRVEDVEGLKEMLEAIRRQAAQSGSSGGGMGNITHQHTAVSSATTTVTTTSKISGGGFAIWAFYNGQMIARGTDYTVGTDFKTLTLTFTPQDSTVMDIVYIRT